MALPVVIVVAAAENGVIGADNKLLWRLKTDLQHFRKLTLGRPLVMGRKTFQSIGKPLPGRETIVVTRDRSFAAAGVHVAHDLAGALALAQERGAALDSDSIVIAGGGEIYAQALAVTERIHLTRVHVSPAGDVTFPRPDPVIFERVSATDHPAGPDDEAAFTVEEWRRR